MPSDNISIGEGGPLTPIVEESVSSSLSLEEQQQLEEDKKKNEELDKTIYPKWNFEFLGNIAAKGFIDYIYKDETFKLKMLAFPWVDEYMSPVRFFGARAFKDSVFPTHIIGTITAFDVYTAARAVVEYYYLEKLQTVTKYQESLPREDEAAKNAFKWYSEQKKLIEYLYDLIQGKTYEYTESQKKSYIEVMEHLNLNNTRDENLSPVKRAIKVACFKMTLANWIRAYELFYYKVQTLCLLMNSISEKADPTLVPKQDLTVPFTLDLFVQNFKEMKLTDALTWSLMYNSQARGDDLVTMDFHVYDLSELSEEQIKNKNTWRVRYQTLLQSYRKIKSEQENAKSIAAVKGKIQEQREKKKQLRKKKQEEKLEKKAAEEIKLAEAATTSTASQSA